jgi:hypothetical protein
VNLEQGSPLDLKLLPGEDRLPAVGLLQFTPSIGLEEWNAQYLHEICQGFSHIGGACSRRRADRKGSPVVQGTTGCGAVIIEKVLTAIVSIRVSAVAGVAPLSFPIRAMR